MVSPLPVIGNTCQSVNVARMCHNGASACPLHVTSTFNHQFPSHLINDGSYNTGAYVSSLNGGTIVIDLMRPYNITRVQYTNNFQGIYNIPTALYISDTNTGQNAQSCGNGNNMACGELVGTSLDQNIVCPESTIGRYFCAKGGVCTDLACTTRNFIAATEIEVFADVCIEICSTTEVLLNNECVNCPAHSTAPSESFSISACSCDTGYTGSNGDECTVCDTGKYKSVAGAGTCQDHCFWQAL